MRRRWGQVLLGVVLAAGCADEAGPPAVPAVVDAAVHDPASVDARPPPRPRTEPLRFFVGQSTPDLSAFRAEVLDTDPGFPRPDGITLYTSVTPGACLGTTDGPCQINGIVHDFQRNLAEYPDAALAVGLYLSDSHAGCTHRTLRALLGQDDPDLAGGVGAAYRQTLDALITYLDSTGRDVYLRIGYEFDGPWNCYAQALYVPAFRAVKARIDALGAERVQTVWQSATYPQDGNPLLHYDFSAPDHLAGWYPGDDVVDWVGLSAFTFGPAHQAGPWGCLTPTTAPRALYDAAARFAESRGKPVMIAEAAPAGYRTGPGAPDVRCIGHNRNPRRLTLDELWAQWYAPLFDFIATTPAVQILAYINSDWQALPQFSCAPGASGGTPECPSGYFGNARLQDAPALQDRFADAIEGLRQVP